MEQIKLSFEPEATPEDIEVVHKGLAGFNRQFDPHPVYQPLRIFLRDANQAIQGGLLGEIWNGWLLIDILWVAEDVRRQGLGAQLLLAAEQEASKHQCYAALLDTFSFQARPFYERMGFEVFAELPDCPLPGMARYYMRKTLRALT
ncbi:MAG TPA: GNAT family N-acetyltransferase [Ktedonobacterales bacterium]|nr:GNAT family N-acetyltransferase [Ktedonobacterales bacterium]